METKIININKEFQLASYEMYNQNSRLGIILIHGLAEHKGRYKDFFKKIYSMNISVFAVDIRGHGESSGKRGDVTDFNIFLTDLKSYIKIIKNKYKNLKLALLGHSLGGLISTGYVEMYSDIDFLILSSPLLTVPKAAKLLNFIPYSLLSFIRVKKRHSESKEMLKYSYNDPLASNYFSIRLLGVIFKEGICQVLNGLQNVKIPVLLLGGKLDPLIQTNRFEEILSQFGCTDKELKIYENVKHRLLQSDIKDDVINDMVIWLNKRL